LKEKKALENLIQSDIWKTAPNAFQNINPTKFHVTNDSELVSLSLIKKQKKT